MTPVLTTLVLRPWLGMAHGPVTMRYEATITDDEVVAWQAAEAGTAPTLGGTVGMRRGSREVGMTLGVTFDRFEAHFGSASGDGSIVRYLNEDYRNRTVYFGPQALAVLRPEADLRPVLGGQLQLWIPSTLQEHGAVRDGYPTYWPPVLVVPGVTVGAELSVSERADLFVHLPGWAVVGGYEAGVTGEAEPPAMSRLGGGVFVGVQLH